MSKIITDIKQPEEYTIEELKDIFNKSRGFRDLCRKLGWDSRSRNKVTSINTLKHFADKIGLSEDDLKNDKIVERFNESRKLEKHCLHCDKLLDEKRARAGAKFCNSSCSASYYNARKGPMSSEQKIKISIGLQSYYAECDVWNKNIRYSINKPHYKKEKEYKSFTYKTHKCKVCEKEYAHKLTPGSTDAFCSKECYHYFLAHRKDFLSEDSLNRIREGAKKSAAKQAEQRRSKNEIEFCNLCELFFKNVEHNKQIFNGWDADVIIHDIKYAVLWNGKWHYEQCNKKHSVKQVQNRDKIKIREIVKHGYTPYIIKDVGKFRKPFVKEQFDIFIQHLKDNKII